MSTSIGPRVNAARAGLHRGLIEFRASMGNAQEVIFGYVLFPALFLGMAFFLDDGDSEGLGIIFTGLVMLMALLGVMTTAQVLATEREDGTLLRSRAVPHGMVGYAVGKTVHILLMSVFSLSLLLVPALLFIDGVAFQGWLGALTLLWVCLLGLTTLSLIGAVLGSLISNPRMGVGLAMLPLMGLVGISGIFTPMDFLPGWIQGIALVFPVYWIGEGVRAALFPVEVLAAGGYGVPELSLVAGVLALWTVIGFLVAQAVLRRMARRTSGSRVQAAREEAMKRAY
ncbi:ABC transporter permease [Nocardiopsis exhalans]|uniref:ABC transporter permease n=1 Tax=Nocardiopsis exhalans TaxID=163604 RepID=A0ABY5DAI7_9ACTN|nr:ABC transporter permease [Nocardiopsis exhalans]USY20015.1 ABC transporter permease [Nocardiopsis exhalans]